MTILEWIIVAVFGLNGFVWLVLPWFIVGRTGCMFSSNRLIVPSVPERQVNGKEN